MILQRELEKLISKINLNDKSHLALLDKHRMQPEDLSFVRTFTEFLSYYQNHKVALDSYRKYYRLMMAYFKQAISLPCSTQSKLIKAPSKRMRAKKNELQFYLQKVKSSQILSSRQTPKSRVVRHVEPPKVQKRKRSSQSSKKDVYTYKQSKSRQIFERKRKQVKNRNSLYDRQLNKVNKYLQHKQRSQSQLSLNLMQDINEDYLKKRTKHQLLRTQLVDRLNSNHCKIIAQKQFIDQQQKQKEIKLYTKIIKQLASAQTRINKNTQLRHKFTVASRFKSHKQEEAVSKKKKSLNMSHQTVVNNQLNSSLNKIAQINKRKQSQLKALVSQKLKGDISRSKIITNNKIRNSITQDRYLNSINQRNNSFAKDRRLIIQQDRQRINRRYMIQQSILRRMEGEYEQLFNKSAKTEVIFRKSKPINLKQR